MSAATANPPVVSHRSRRQLARIWRDLSGVSKVSVIILIVVILMQRWFVRGLISTEK